ncbi:FecR domain-containing protein [Sphingomonas sp. KR3-1]|uniref:FecR family protein n=1 Tax=Sphingomonas sp. KR3-1 TaxID=3156611 RepID=UPI0032B5F322
MNAESDAALREAAAEWFARMRAPDAERDRSAFEAWLAEDVRHRRAYDRMLMTWEQSRLVTHTPAGEAYKGLPKRMRSRRPAWRYAFAAGVGALFAIGVLLVPRDHSAGPQVAAQEVTSPVGIRKVRLGDGSIVTLDVGARLTVRFSGRERRVQLDAGRARFEVVHDATRAFVVAAIDQEIVATGTTFDVTCMDGKISVALLRGNVEIRQFQPGASRVPIARLASGQSVDLASGASKPVPHMINPAARDWPSGMVEFDGAPLREVIAIANRYSARRIVLGDPAIGELRVTGGYRMGDAQALAATLAAAFGLRVESGPDQSIVLKGTRSPAR